MSEIVEVVCADRDALAVEAARRIENSALSAVAERGVFHLVLAGGSTPRAAYALLARSAGFPITATQFWWGDERCVEADHPDSNFDMVGHAWLRSANIVTSQIHRMKGELGAEAGCEEYREQLHAAFDGGAPRFDLILLGIGDDAHTASLFPGRPEAFEHAAWVVAAWGPKPPQGRISLGLAALRAGRETLFLAGGRDKDAALTRLFGGDPTAPAAVVAAAASNCTVLRAE